ncbi:MAG: DUF4743 domain-containing protein [Thiotrichales bacterium]
MFQGFLDRIAESNRFSPTAYLPFTVAQRTLGWVLPEFARALAEFPDVFEVTSTGVSLRDSLCDVRARSEALAEVVEQLRARGVIHGRYDERYAISARWHAPAVFELERAAVSYFGLPAFGVHINGLVQTAHGLEMWVARRALDRPNFPGMLDHLAAGGQPANLSLRENVAKECHEEAGIPASLAAEAVAVGSLRYCTAGEKGLKQDTIFMFDLLLSEDFTPVNQDGEVAAFERWPLTEVARVVATTRDFKPNCNLVIIDCLLRLGGLDLAPAQRDALAHALRTPPEPIPLPLS